MRKVSSLVCVPVFVASLALILSGLTGCGSSSVSVAEASDLPSRVAEAAQRNAPVSSGLVAANNRFAFTLFDQLRRKDAGKNVFVSPVSITLALQIIYNGARGQTQQDMAQALQIQGLSLSDLNEGNAALQASLIRRDPKVTLTIANSLWIRQGTNEVTPAFIQTNRDYYGSEVGDLSGVPDSVNAWVSRKTNQRITKILPQDDYSDIVAILVNAVYFKGAWTKKFDPSKTQTSTFTRSDGTTIPCKLMPQSGTYSYLKGSDFQAVRLPYGDKRLSLAVFLPDAGTSLDTLLSRLTAANWNDWMTQFADKHGEIALPRFKTEYEVNLKEALSALGMEIAFDPNGRADFTGIAQNAYLKFVKHKTFLEVTEEGTEAAGATSVGVGITSVPIPFKMKMDRPFLCAIRDDVTGTLLFLGVLANPG